MAKNKNLIPASQPAMVPALAGEDEVTASSILEFQSPTLGLVNAPAPMSARTTTWIMASMVVATFAIFAAIPVDRTVSVPGIVHAQAPNVIVQPLETAIVREIYVHDGEKVKKGQLLAELDPTFAQSDSHAADAQEANLRAQVERMRAELADTPYTSDGTQYGNLEELAYLQRHQQFQFTVEDYNAKIASLQAKVNSAKADIASLTAQIAPLKTSLQKYQEAERARKELERLQVGAKLNTIQAEQATAQAELELETGQQKLADAQHALVGAERDFAAMQAERDSWVHQWYADTQNQESDKARMLADISGQASKNALRTRLTELRAPQDSVVLNVSRVAPGTVLQSGAELMTTVPVDSPLEVTGLVDGSNIGFIKPGDMVRIKFDTLPYFRYGYGEGHVERTSADSFIDPTQGQVNPQATAPNINSTSPAAAGGAPVYFYRVFVSIDRLKLRHAPQAFSVKPGMPLVLDINVGKRTIFSYLIDKVVPFLANGMQEPT
jgi:HlyD family secretion protein